MVSVKEGSRVQVDKLLVWHREGIKPNSVRILFQKRTNKEKYLEKRGVRKKLKMGPGMKLDIDSIFVYIIKFFIVNYVNVHQVRFLVSVCFR